MDLGFAVEAIANTKMQTGPEQTDSGQVAYGSWQTRCMHYAHFMQLYTGEHLAAQGCCCSCFLFFLFFFFFYHYCSFSA